MRLLPELFKCSLRRTLVIRLKRTFRSGPLSAPSLSAFRRAALVACALLLLPHAGCRSGDGEPSGEAEPAKKQAGQAQSRRSVDERTATLLIQSQQALQQGALRAARVLSDSVTARAPRLPDAHFQRGRVLSELKQFGEAEEAYQRLLALDPDYRGVWYNRGNNAYRQQDYLQAAAFYQRAQAQHPAARTLVALGWTYVAQNKVDSARVAYEQAVSLDASYALAHARLGQLYDDQGNAEEALRHSRRALELEPENSKYQYAVGAQLLRLGRPEAAAKHLRKATAERPWPQGAHFSLGQALMRLGQAEEAERYLADADSLEQLQSDIKELRAATRSSADNPAVWKELGEKLQAAGQLEDARQAFGVALYLRPDNPLLRNRLAMLLAELGRPEAAVKHFQALLTQHPSYAEGWFNLGVVHARSGRAQKARKAWQEVLRHHPNHEQAKAYLARTPPLGSS